MNDKRVNGEIQLLDVVALTDKLPDHNLWRGEIGAVVECYPGDAYEVEFVAKDGYTYALVTLRAEQIIPLQQKEDHSDSVAVPVAF